MCALRVCVCYIYASFYVYTHLAKESVKRWSKWKNENQDNTWCYKSRERTPAAKQVVRVWAEVKAAEPDPERRPPVVTSSGTSVRWRGVCCQQTNKKENFLFKSIFGFCSFYRVLWCLFHLGLPSL